MPGRSGAEKEAETYFRYIRGEFIKNRRFIDIF
jgi:hypothetical protein